MTGVEAAAIGVEVEGVLESAFKMSLTFSLVVSIFGVEELNELARVGIGTIEGGVAGATVGIGTIDGGVVSSL